MCADAVCFTPKAGGPLSSRSQQLRHVLQQRKEPLKLTLTVISSGSAEVEEMAALLAEVAATSRPVRGDGGAPLCCVEQLIVKVRIMHAGVRAVAPCCHVARDLAHGCLASCMHTKRVQLKCGCSARPHVNLLLRIPVKAVMWTHKHLHAPCTCHLRKCTCTCWQPHQHAMGSGTQHAARVLSHIHAHAHAHAHTTMMYCTFTTCRAVVPKAGAACWVQPSPTSPTSQ